MKLEIVRVVGLATVQDRGREGVLALGVPVGGALSPERLRAANAAVGNDASAAGIEITGTLRLRLCGGDGHRLVSIDGASAHTITAGDTLDVASARARAVVVAIAGGIDTPIVLGGRGATLVAALGPPLLASGQTFALGATVAAPRPAPVLLTVDVIGLVPGPDAAAFPPGAFTAFVSHAHVLARAGDRSGVRLELAAGAGAAWQPLPGASSRPSAPMVRGAVQITPSGEAIVLGPEHPVTGGYPLIGVIATSDIGELLVRPPGQIVRFQPK